MVQHNQETLDLAGKSLFGGTGNDLGSTDSAVNGLYGEGRFAYTANDVSDSVANGDLTIASASWADVNYDASLSASVADGSLASIKFNASELVRPDLDGVRSFYISSSDFSAADSYYPAHSSVSGVVGAEVITTFAKLSSLGGDLAVKHSQQPIAANRGDFEDSFSI